MCSGTVWFVLASTPSIADRTRAEARGDRRGPPRRGSIFCGIRRFAADCHRPAVHRPSSGGVKTFDGADVELTSLWIPQERETCGRLRVPTIARHRQRAELPRLRRSGLTTRRHPQGLTGFHARPKNRPELSPDGDRNGARCQAVLRHPSNPRRCVFQKTRQESRRRRILVTDIAGRSAADGDVGTCQHECRGEKEYASTSGRFHRAPQSSFRTVCQRSPSDRRARLRQSCCDSCRPALRTRCRRAYSGSPTW